MKDGKTCRQKIIERPIKFLVAASIKDPMY